jgi:glycosyltransferase involved in cell wall biosynthesis
MRSQLPVVFVQGFGRGDLFTATPPEALWGWQRNVGLLVALLNHYGIPWVEQFAPNLSEISAEASLFILRDWRYPPEAAALFCQKAPAPVVSMLFQGPQAFLEAQRQGEEQVLAGTDEIQVQALHRGAEDGLFEARQVVVRSRLNAGLFAQLGYPPENMVCMPHAPLWTRVDGQVAPARLPAPVIPVRSKADQNSFNLLFIGESLWRKGIIPLYRAFKRLAIPNKKLHIYNRQLSAGGSPGVSNRMEPWQSRWTAEMISDPEVVIHRPYQDIPGLLNAQRSADLLVCPSLLDCGPNVLVEGYQLGTPLLASDLCGTLADLPPESIATVKAPRWWESLEPAQAYEDRLYQAITRCLSNPSTRPAPPPSDVAAQLQSILSTWETVLDEYALIPSSRYKMHVFV